MAWTHVLHMHPGGVRSLCRELQRVRWRSILSLIVHSLRADLQGCLLRFSLHSTTFLVSMASVLDLVYKDSTEINEIARENDLSGRGSMSKAEKIEALCDEHLTKESAKILRAKKSALIPRAKEAGIASPYSKSKAELQALLIEREGFIGNGSAETETSSGSGASSSDAAGENGMFPASDLDGTERAPQASLQSHFESAEKRMSAIRDAAHQAMDRSLDEGAKYVVIESFRPKDASQPIKIQPSYHKRHPDTIVVVEADVAQWAFPISTADPNPVFRSP